MNEFISDPSETAPERHYPKEESLGKLCLYWVNGKCGFPKAEMEGRTSCGGFVDDVCLEIKDGRTAVSLTQQQSLDLRTRLSKGFNNEDIPPGLYI